MCNNSFELYAKINPKILIMKIQGGKKKKRQHNSVPGEYTIHKFKIQALPMPGALLKY